MIPRDHALGYYPGSAVVENPLVAFVTNLATRPSAYLIEEQVAPTTC